MMRNVILVSLILVASSVVLAQAPRSSDQAAIVQAIDNWNKAWQAGDAKLAAKDYSEDADWTNAFGMSKKGRANIEAFLTEVFRLSFVIGGQSKVIEQSIRFVNPDVALVVTHVERVGQKTPAGEDLGTRKTSHLRAFAKTASGWRIVSHLIADARDTKAPTH